MSLFRPRRTGPALPANVIAMMERFGRSQLDPALFLDEDELYACEPLFGLAASDADGLASAIAEVCVPVGGWAAFGAARLVDLLCEPIPSGVDAIRLRAAAVEFLRANLVQPVRVARPLWDYFIATGGTINTWVELKMPPTREAAVLTPLEPGESRPLLRLGKDPDTIVIVVRQDGSEFVALVDARYSDADPTGNQQELKRAATQYDLYFDVAWSNQLWEWAHEELLPFIPAPRPLI